MVENVIANKKYGGCQQIGQRFWDWFTQNTQQSSSMDSFIVIEKCWDHRKWHNLVPQLATWWVVISESMSLHGPQWRVVIGEGVSFHRHSFTNHNSSRGKLWQKVVPFLVVVAQLQFYHTISYNLHNYQTVIRLYHLHIRLPLLLDKKII